MLYEITLTLRPKMYSMSAKDQYKYLESVLRDIFKPSIKEEYKVSLIAELTAEDNVHYHGIVELKNFKERARLIDSFRKYHSTIGKKSITQLVHYPLWVEYINKAISNTRQLIKDPIVFDDHQVLCDPKYRFLESL